jgi:hypothetical protein
MTETDPVTPAIHNLLPVSLSTEGLRTATGAVGDPTALKIPEPAELSSLQQESYQLQASFAAQLGFPVASLSTDDKLSILIYGVTRYSDVVDQKHTFRYGVAIRVLLEIYSAQLDGDLALPMIAAKAQLGVVSAGAQLLLYGYTGEVAGTLPSWQSFDVDSYADYLRSISALQKQVLTDTEHIKPVLLASTLAAELRPDGGRNGRLDLDVHGERRHSWWPRPSGKEG